MEFMFMIMAATLSLIIFMTVFSELYQDNMRDRKRILALDYGYALQNEFLIASSAKEGYFREFAVPQRLENYDYSINVINNSLSLNYSDALVYFALPDHSGELVKGINNIQNINGTICVNC